MRVNAAADTMVMGNPVGFFGEGLLGSVEFAPGVVGLVALGVFGAKLTSAAAMEPRMILNSSHARNVRSVAR
jgi:hypothetical protein